MGVERAIGVTYYRGRDGLFVAVRPPVACLLFGAKEDLRLCRTRLALLLSPSGPHLSAETPSVGVDFDDF